MLATSVGGRAQSASSLSNLPEADTLIYVNTQRILNEAAPRLLSEKQLADMRKGFSDAKQFAGVDPSKVEYLIIALRSRRPAADLSFVPPEIMAVTSGDFSAESLIGLARAASDGKLRDEKYGTKTISLMTIDPVAKEAEKNPMLKSFSEVAIVPLNATTLAVGSPAYLRAAIDASEGNGRISSERLSSLLRDPSVLISVAGSPWNSFGKSFGLQGTEANPRAPKCESNLGDFYAAVTMDSTNFMVRGAVGADNPETAQIINNLLSGLLRHAATSIPDKAAQTALQTISLKAQENEVTLSADIPQQMLIEFMKSQMMSPKKDEASSGTPTPTAKKPAVKRRRRGRKG
jgi:hypothetical protein